MPFKALAGLKKITKLDAEVVALAQLRGEGMFAAITNDPAMLAFGPFSGSGVKSKNISLDGVNGLAFINKSVVVVKSSDQLWAIIDIAHTAKIEQCGRDIGTLAARPKGATALTVGYDGQGAELELKGYEVGGRHFVLRGDHRCVSIGNDDHTHTVVQQGDGQYRQHPGATPEPAPSGRADLPSEAKTFNRIAGGIQLSAIYKKGSTQVCVVRAEGGNQYGAKVVTVDSAVNGAAVIESSLFVICSDGKLRLYNADTLQASIGDVMAPTNELDLRVGGEPRVIMSSTRGGNKLWVGTNSGDVVRCDAIKQGLNI